MSGNEASAAVATTSSAGGGPTPPKNAKKSKSKHRKPVKNRIAIKNAKIEKITTATKTKPAENLTADDSKKTDDPEPKVPTQLEDREPTVDDKDVKQDENNTAVKDLQQTEGPKDANDHTPADNKELKKEGNNESTKPAKPADNAKVYKSKNRKRRNRKALKKPAVVPEVEPESTASVTKGPILSYSEVVKPLDERLHDLSIGPEAIRSHSETDEYSSYSDPHDSDDDWWEQDYGGIQDSMRETY